jgi:hypothetical protein
LTPGLTLFPSAATITAPFVLSGGLISQPLTTTVGVGGSAVYQVSNAVPGNYMILGWVKAPDTNSNSFYVNVDAQPTDPTMIWNVPVSPSLTGRFVTWQGVSDNVAKVFFLSAGTHQIIVRGREGNTQLENISFFPAPFNIQSFGANLMYLSGLGQASHAYDIQVSSDFKTWTKLTTVTTDATGAFSYMDTPPATVKARYYRLRG